MGLNSGRLHDAVTTAQLSAIDTQLAEITSTLTVENETWEVE